MWKWACCVWSHWMGIRAENRSSCLTKPRLSHASSAVMNYARTYTIRRMKRHATGLSLFAHTFIGALSGMSTTPCKATTVRTPTSLALLTFATTSSNHVHTYQDIELPLQSMMRNEGLVLVRVRGGGGGGGGGGWVLYMREKDESSSRRRLHPLVHASVISWKFRWEWVY
jgi:hypothetical protein